MTDELTPDELEEQNGEPLPDREAMSVVNPVGGTDLFGEEVFPSEPDIGDPTLP